MIEHWDTLVALVAPSLVMFGALRQRVMDLEARVANGEHEWKEKSALLMDIRERVIVIEQCVKHAIKTQDRSEVS